MLSVCVSPSVGDWINRVFEWNHITPGRGSIPFCEPSRHCQQMVLPLMIGDVDAADK